MQAQSNNIPTWTVVEKIGRKMQQLQQKFNTLKVCVPMQMLLFLSSAVLCLKVLTTNLWLSYRH